MKFEGTQAYVATDDLKLAVNAAITRWSRVSRAPARPCWPSSWQNPSAPS